MSIVARDVSALSPFSYSPEGEEVSFRLRGLSTAEVADVNALSIYDAENKQVRFPARAILAALRAGLLGWDGLPTAAGEPARFSKDMAENLERLGYPLAMQLVGKIMEASRLTEEQAKN
jgi:hypothetical protein